RAPLLESRIGRHPYTAPRAPPDGHQPLRLAERKWTEQRRIDHAEHQAVRADAERQRQNRRSSESRAAADTSQREMYIASGFVEPAPSPHVTSLLAPGERTTKGSACGVRIAGFESFHLQVKLELA